MTRKNLISLTIGTVSAIVTSHGLPSAAASAAPMIYSFTPIPGGPSLTGYVVTDGTVGALGASNVISWTYTTGGFTAQGTGAHVFTALATASASGLNFPVPSGFGSPGAFAMRKLSNGFYSDNLFLEGYLGTVFVDLRGSAVPDGVNFTKSFSSGPTHTFALAANPGATTFIWTGPSGGTWDNASPNWTGSLGPVWLNRSAPADAARFDNAGTVNVNPGISVNRIEFTGNTTLSGGSLDLITNGSSNPTFDVAAGANATIGSSLSGSGNFEKTGSGTLLLAGNNSFAGGATVSGGTLAVDGNQSVNRLAPNTLVTVNTGGTFEIRGVNALPFLANSADVTANAGGTLRVVSGQSAATAVSHAHLRNVTLNDGAIVLDYAGTGSAYDGSSFKLNGDLTSTGNSSVTFGSATAATGGIGLAGARTFNVPGGTLTVSAEIQDDADSAPGQLNKIGGGTLVLGGVNTFSGGVSSSDFGTLAVTSDAALGAPNNAIRLNNGIIRTDAPMTIARDVNIDAGKVGFLNTNGNDVTLGGKVDGVAGFIKQGPGTLTLTNTANGQSNNRIDGGTLAITDDRQLGLPGGPLFMWGGTLRANAPVTLARPVSLLADSTIDFFSHDIILAGPIDAPAGTTLTLRGVLDGSVRVTGNATGSGGTILRADTNVSESETTRFVIGNGGTGGSLPSGPIRFDLVDGSGDTGRASLTFDRSDTYTVASNISSNRALEYLTVRGGGTMFYSGNASATGQVRVVNGSSLVINGTVVQVSAGGFEPGTSVFGQGSIGGTGSIALNTIVTSGTIRGDWGSGTGTLTIGGGLGISGGTSGGTLAVQLLTDAAGNIADQSNLSADNLAIYTTVGPVSIRLLNDADLNLGQTYSIELVEVRSGRLLRNSAFVSSYNAADFNLLSSSGFFFGDVTPTITNNRLMLSFTVIPEPASLALLAGAGVIALRRSR